MRVLIIGCGRVGGLLAGRLSDFGHDVSVVDANSRAFRRLPEKFPGRVVLGTGIDEDVLRTAGVEQADVYVAVTEDDNTNIMSAQIARSVFGIDRVILRIYDQARAAVYRQLGLTVICPTTTVAGMIEDEVLRSSSTTTRIP
ncbi:MAG TPA: TrkA family potassium uptake protein [Nitrolancea sp.]|jgi:trk system potassium uptake protein TrkA|nr:TrkA family potassium uptake protein [Nitrolancea sp.]